MKTFLFLAFSIITFISQAQQNYFVYLQTDNKQPFYIKLNEQLYSSSGAGYLVVPKLQNGTYNFSVGFPRAEWPEQMIAVNINNKDEGFLLKNFNEKGWGFFNLQTLEVLMTKTSNTNKASSAVTSNDEFSNVLSGVVNTPGLNEKSVDKVIAAPETPKVEKPILVNIEIEKPVLNSNTITKLSSAMDDDGSAFIYLDKTEKGTDTVNIFIENKSTILPQAELTIEKPETPKDSFKTAIEIERKETVDKEPLKQPGFIAIELPNPNTVNDSRITNSTSSAPKEEKSSNVPKPEQIDIPASDKPVINIINSDCKQLATDEDFLKLRKKMASYDKDEDMVIAAKKSFKTKCYSTDQVKNLSVLFLTDAAKYQFFDSAYPFVHDSSRFGSLQSQLTDTYFINRFKAMVRQ